MGYDDGGGVNVLRLVFAILVLLVSLLAVFPEPTYNLWKLSIAVTEWGHVLALIALLVLLPGWNGSVVGRVAAGLGVVAAMLALSPLVRAMAVARVLPGQLDVAFGGGTAAATETAATAEKAAATPAATAAATRTTTAGAEARRAPLVLVDLVRGVESPAVEVTTHGYVVRDAVTLELDLYRAASGPAGAKGAVSGLPGGEAPREFPIVVMIHGGSWRGGARTELAGLNPYLAARGYAVAAISYRLAPEHPHPAASEDVSAAIEYLKSHATELGLDASRIALIGRSAGGQLALLAGYTSVDPAIRGVVAFYAPTDQKWGYDHPSKPRVFDSRGILEGFLGGTPAAVPDAYATSSPINYVGAHTIPTLLIHGRRDELVFAAQSERLAMKLRAAGRPHFYLELPWGRHGCDFNFNGPCGQLSTYAVERFLGGVLR